MEIATISVPRLAIAFVPVTIVVFLMWRWGQGYARSLTAVARMLLQLTLVGYVLVYIFRTDSGLVISGVLTVMLLAAGWIALNTASTRKAPLFLPALFSVALGGSSTLVLITQGVLQLDPWFRPNVMIPLAGMIFSASMNNISLALERLQAELANGCAFHKARNIAFRTSMIPPINTFLAVGLISLPGMMTGQILSGVSPLIAVRYQIMVMCMMFGAAGLSTVCFMTLLHRSGRYPESQSKAEQPSA